jgi:hypothetical protein
MFISGDPKKKKKSNSIILDLTDSDGPYNEP